MAEESILSRCPNPADVKPLAVARAKLPASNLDLAVFAVAEECGAIYRAYEDFAVDAIVYLHLLREVEQVDFAVLAEFDHETLAVNITWTLYQRLVLTLQEDKILRVGFGSHIVQEIRLTSAKSQSSRVQHRNRWRSADM